MASCRKGEERECPGRPDFRVIPATVEVLSCGAPGATPGENEDGTPVPAKEDATLSLDWFSFTDTK